LIPKDKGVGAIGERMADVLCGQQPQSAPLRMADALFFLIEIFRKQDCAEKRDCPLNLADSKDSASGKDWRNASVL